MNKSRAIKEYCLDCSGGQVDERMGCVMFDCPLWEHRLGVQAGKPSYEKRIKTFFKSGRKVATELRGDGLEEKDYQRPKIKVKKIGVGILSSPRE